MVGAMVMVVGRSGSRFVCGGISDAVVYRVRFVKASRLGVAAPAFSILHSPALLPPLLMHAVCRADALVAFAARACCLFCGPCVCVCVAL